MVGKEADMASRDLSPSGGVKSSGEGNGFTPGPWIWFGSTYPYPRFYLSTERHGRRIIMDMVRAGTQGAQPRFQENGRMVPASEMVRYDVEPSVRGKTAAKAPGSGVYREDFSVIDHPDARLIAAAPDHALAGWAMCVQDARWEEWVDGRGEFCFAGLRHATTLDEFGCPVLTDHLRALLTSAKAAIAKATPSPLPDQSGSDLTREEQ